MMFEPADLLAAAVAARDRAYVPYSRFPVGAALITPDGRIFNGANVENASYGLTMCAERVAVYHALSQGVQTFSAVAVTGPDGIVAMPCGACRQVLNEFGPTMDVVFPDASGSPRVLPLADLLPYAFSGTTLTDLAGGSAQRDGR